MFRLLRRLVGVALILVGAGAWANYPDRPIQWVVPYPAGGAADQVSRLIATRLSERLGQQVLVDNRAGAGGVIAEEYVARAKPDGYTVMYDAFALAVNAAVRKLKFDPENDLVPVTQFANMWVVMLAPADAPYKTLPEFLDYARKNPQSVSLGVAGAGASPHLAAELFFTQMAKIDILRIPYRGGAPTATALMAKEISTYFATGPSTLPFIRGSKMRALGVAAPRRLAALPDVPTFVELGYPELLVSEWAGMFVPKETPADIVQRLHQEVRTIMNDPKIVEHFSAQLGIEAMSTTPVEFSRFVRSETRRWGDLIKKLDLQIN